MIYCPNCGAPAEDGTFFCSRCGASMNAAPRGYSIRPVAGPQYPQQPSAPQYPQQPQQPQYAPQYQPPQPGPQYQQPAPQYQPQQPPVPQYQPQPTAVPQYGGGPDPNQVFAAVTVRHRCPNGHVFDGTAEQVSCPKCGAPLVKGGYIQLYRMGNPMGCAVGMGVFVDGVGHGHIGNQQSIRISVPYGSHKLHVTHTTTRKCNDPIFTVTPECPYAWCKAHFTKAGFAIAVEQASPADMPMK